MAIVREDVVKLSFDFDGKGVDKANAAVDDLLKDVQDLGGSGGAGKAEDGFDAARKAAKKFGETDLSSLTSGLDNVLQTVGKIAVQMGVAAAQTIAVGAAAATAGFAALGKQSIEGYAEYEQLVGGVDTLFAKNSKTVQGYAENAYKTAGMSANDYMATVTGFSASMINSLGGDTEKAAKLSNQAITDMSDNANKMGTDMGSIQDAYQGFAKHNYTMLDNLKLGYGGTQEEMERLLRDAEELTGKSYKLYKFSDVTEAIHAIQTEMGITGTTAAEASSTIQGSANAMASAWQNFLTGMANENADFDVLMANLIDSAVTFADNLIPRIEKMLPRLIHGLTEIAQTIGDHLPDLLQQIMPDLAKGIRQLLVSAGDVIVACGPILKQAGLDTVKALYEGITGKEMDEAMFAELTAKVDGVLDAFKNIAKELGKVAQAVAPVVLWLMDVAVMAFTWIGDNANWLVPVLTTLLGAFLAFKAVSSVTGVVKGFLGVFGKGSAGGGSGGGGLLGGGGGLFDMQPSKVLKGLANIGIIVLGFTALAAVIMWAAPYMAELTDAGSLAKVGATIAAVGVVGALLTKLAGWVGKIPTAVVLTGLENIALVLGGFTVVVAAFAALSCIDGFNEFIAKGGETLTALCNILGEMVGAVIGGIGEGLTASLPTIGDNLSAFATSLEPMFKTFAGVDTEGLSSFAGALAALIAVIAGEKLVSVITGGIDYAELGTNLSDMASNLSGFFTAIMTIPEGGFDKATALFDCLAGISSMPKEGGVVGWFEGEVDYSKMATGLGQLSGEGVKNFFTMAAGLSDTAFANATKLFDCLAGVKSLPKDGGVVGWFTGTINYDNLVAGIQKLASDGMVSALTTIANIPEAGFTGLTKLFNALAGIKQMPKEGGIASWFTGNASTALTTVAAALPGVATNIANFFKNLGERTDFSPIKGLFETLGNIDIDADAASKGFLGLGTSDFEKLGTGLSNFATNASTFFDKIEDVTPEEMLAFFDALGKAGDLPGKLEGVNETVGLTLSDMVAKVDLHLTTIKDNINTSIDSMIATVNLKQTAFFSAGMHIMLGLNAGIKSMRSTLMSTANSIANDIRRTLEAAMDVHSPSRVTYEIGAYIGKGLEGGMMDSVPSLRTAAAELGTASTPYTGGYTPESSSSTIYNNGGDSEYTSIAPVFNLTVSGTQDDRATARRVKKYVAEAIKETFESLDRKTYAIREV